MRTNSKNNKRTLFILVIVLISLFFGQTLAPLQAQETDEDSQAFNLLNQLTPEERVGELFLVTFLGTDVGPETQIYNLINSYPSSYY